MPDLSQVGASRARRYMTDAEYHARVTVAANYLENWDFSKGAGENREFYIRSAMDLIDAIDGTVGAGPDLTPRGPSES